MHVSVRYPALMGRHRRSFLVFIAVVAVLAPLSWGVPHAASDTVTLDLSGNSAADDGKVVIAGDGFISLRDDDGATYSIPLPGSRFRPVDLEDGMIIVGDPDFDGGRGRVHVLRPQLDGSYDIYELTDSIGEFGDGFGQNVAVEADRILVSTTPLRGLEVLVYDFDGSEYGYVGEIVPNDKTEFNPTGLSLELSDGTIVVGEAVANQGAGNVYVFKPQTSTTFSVDRIELSGSQQNDLFGIDVAMSNGILVVGMPGSGPPAGNDPPRGAAVVYTPTSDGYFVKVLRSICVDGSSTFGRDVDIDENGRILVSAAQDNGGAGGAFLYAPDGAGGYSEARLASPSLERRPNFGTFIALSAEDVVVGEFGAELTYFDPPTSPNCRAYERTVASAVTLDQILAADDYDRSSGPAILRLYQAFFNRTPDAGGAVYWLELNRTDAALTPFAASHWFAQSREFETAYSGTNDEEYLRRIYENILGRDFDPDGFNYWLDLLRGTNQFESNPDLATLSRSEVVFYVAASEEFAASYPFEPGSSVGLEGDR